MNAGLRETTSCEVCGNAKPSPVLDLGKHPLCDDLVPTGDVRINKEYPIEILFCHVCRTAHQRFQIPKQDLFPQSYHYRARHTADVLKGMEQLVETTEKHVGEQTSRKILDIGCNDGSLLSLFRKKGAKTFGVEPTGAWADAKAAGHEVVHDYFSEDVAERFVRRHGQPDIITFTNVFAHIEDLKQLIRSLKIVCKPETTIVIENHYLGAVLAQHQFDTFYHEHPRTYSYTSFTHIANSLGMQVSLLEFPQRYGGNIRVFLQSQKNGKVLHDQNDKMEVIEAGFAQNLARMKKQIKIWQTHKQKEIEKAVKTHGKLAAKAFPGRAAIPLKLLGVDENLISAVYEKPQSAKIGHYVPGTRIPILSDEKLLASIPRGAPLLNLAWHITDEIRAYMKKQGFTGGFIDIISPADFSGTA